MLTLLRRIKCFEIIFHFQSKCNDQTNGTELTVYNYYINDKSFTTI